MIGERKKAYTNTDYGTLTMRAFDIDGNNINAFYDAQNNLVFVLDNTLNVQKPNVLLVINPDGDKKWDEILSNEYGVDLETIRPKVDNKYQKLDIEYSGLGVYEKLIKAYDAGKNTEEELNQLTILRDSAARHSAVTRLNVANETIAKSNATIVKTKETIVALESRIKTLRSKLSTEKKSIGKVNTKQSASKILKLESQIEATKEKLKRAKKRLESAQKRLEAATVDAELASNLLNQPATEVKQKTKNKPVMVAPEYPVQTIDDDVSDEDDEEYEEDDDEVVESDVKPLFAEDPQILNDNIAFKPIEFDAPVFSEEAEVKDTSLPVVETKEPVVESGAPLESRPVLESFTPIDVPSFVPEPVMEEKTEIVEEQRPVIETIKPAEQDTEIDIQFQEPDASEKTVQPAEPVVPVAPVVNTFNAPMEIKAERSKPGFIYYVLLFVLIVLSVFTLWLYQRNMATDSAPVLAAKVSETAVLKPAPKVDVANQVSEEPVFLTDAPTTEKTVVQEPESDENVEFDESSEPLYETEQIDEAPVVIDAVPERLNTSGFDAEEEPAGVSEEYVLANKPVYEPGTKHRDIFVNEKDTESESEQGYRFIEDPYYDAEEAAYQAEMRY